MGNASQNACIACVRAKATPKTQKNRNSNAFSVHASKALKTLVRSALPSAVNRRGELQQPRAFLLLYFRPKVFLPQKAEAVLSGVAFNPAETRFDVAPARRGEPEDFLVIQRRFRPTFITGFFIDATCFFQAQYGGLKRNECPYNRF